MGPEWKGYERCVEEAEAMERAEREVYEAMGWNWDVTVGGCSQARMLYNQGLMVVVVEGADAPSCSNED